MCAVKWKSASKSRRDRQHPDTRAGGATRPSIAVAGVEQSRCAFACLSRRMTFETPDPVKARVTSRRGSVMAPTSHGFVNPGVPERPGLGYEPRTGDSETTLPRPCGTGSFNTKAV